MRLIDADEVLKNIDNIQSGEYDQFDKETVWLIGINDAMSCLETAPTVDAEPVRHGKWKLVVEQVGNGYEVCSCCGYHHLVGDDKYCPHCGAKMDEVTE